MRREVVVHPLLSLDLAILDTVPMSGSMSQAENRLPSCLYHNSEAALCAAKVALRNPIFLCRHVCPCQHYLYRDHAFRHGLCLKLPLPLPLPLPPF
jgi:hypothetical protein